MTPSEDKNRVCGFGLHRNIFRKTSKTKTTAQESLVPDNPPANKQQNPEQTPNPHAKTLDSAHKEPFRPKFYFPPGYRPKPQLEMGQSGSQTPEAERKPTPIFVDGKLVAIPKSKMSESGERNIVTPKKPSPKLKDVADTGKENAPHGSPTRSMPGAFPAASSSAVAIFPKAFGLDQSNSNSKVSEESSKAVETGFIKFESPLSPSVVNNDFDSSPKYCPPSNLGLPKYGFDFGKADKNYEVPRGGFSFGDGPTSSASAASSALTSKTLFESSLASIAQPTTSLFRPTGVFQQGQSKSNLGPFNNATPSQASQGEGSQLFDSTTTSTTNQTGNKIFSNIPMSDDRRDHLESRSKKQRQGSRNIDFTAQPTQSVEPTSTVENPFRHLNPEQNHMVEKPSLKAARDPKVSATSNERLASWARVPAFTTSDGPSDLPFNNLSLNVATNTTSTTTAPTAHTNPKPSMSTMVDTSVQTMTSRPDTISLDEHVRWLDRFIHVKMPTSVHPSAHAGVLPVPVARQILNNKAGEFAHARRTAGNLADANKAELSSAEVDNGYEKGDRYAKLLHMKTELAKEMSEAERAFAEWKADDEMFTGLKDERDRFLRELTELRQKTDPTVIADLRKVVATKTERIAVLEKVIGSKDKELAAAKKDVDDKRLKLLNYGDIEKREKELKAREDTLNASVAKLTADVHNANIRLQNEMLLTDKQAKLLDTKDNRIVLLNHELEMQEWESKKMKKDLDAAKQEIDSLRHLKEEVFTRKQERDKARYELEWSQRKIENLERERKELEKSCKALKETSSELQKRQADTWKEREKYLQGLRELEEDLRQSEAEKEYWKCKAEEHPDVVVTEKRAGDPVPTMAGIPDRRHVDFEVENVRLRRAVKEMRRKLKENENATGDLIETINELSVENAKWESAKLEKARRDAERENK